MSGYSLIGAMVDRFDTASTLLMSIQTASATRYFGLAMGGCFNSDDSTNNVAYGKHTCRAAGTLDKLVVTSTSNTRASSSTTLNSYKNSSTGAQSVSFSASTSGTVIDSVNSDTLAAGNTFQANVVSGSGTGAFVWSTCAERFLATSGTAGVIGMTQASNTGLGATSEFFVASKTYYMTYFGSCFSNNQQFAITTESVAQSKVRAAGTLSNLQCMFSVNNRTNATSVNHRNGSVSGNNAVSVTATTTGLFEDTTSSDTLADGDLINTMVITGTTNNFLQPSRIVATVTYSSNLTEIGAGDTLHASGSAFPSSTFTGIMGTISNGASATESNFQQNIQVASTWAKSRINVPASTSSATTVTSRKNAGAGAQSISVSATTTGYFEDSTNTDTLVAGDLINFAIGSHTGTLDISLIISTLNAVSGSPKLMFHAFP